MTRVTDWESPDSRQNESSGFLVVSLRQCGATAILEDAGGTYVRVANLVDAWQLPLEETPTDLTIFGAELAAELAGLKARVRRAGEQGSIETSIGDQRCFRFIAEPVVSSDGTGVLTTIIEITEERRRERALNELLREVSHRSKNLLAIIQSIAAQTARHSETIDEFVSKFRGRLYSLSLSQDLITDSLWRGATFGDLVKGQISRYLPEIIDQVSVEGSDIVFPPNAAIHLGLALHELALNAATHGGGAALESTIDVACTTERKGRQVTATFRWREERRVPVIADAAEAEAPEPHFGRIVLERVLPASVAGTAHYDVEESGISYTLEFPLEATHE